MLLAKKLMSSLKPILGPLTYVGADRTASLDGDLIFVIQHATSSSPPTTPTGYTSLASGTAMASGVKQGAPEYAYVSFRVSAAVSSSAVRSASVSGLVRTLVVGGPDGSGSKTLDWSTLGSTGSTDVSGFNRSCGLLQVATAIDNNATGANAVPGTVDGVARDNYVQYAASASAGGGGEEGEVGVASYDVEVSFWNGNFIPDSPVTTAGSGSQLWLATDVA